MQNLDLREWSDDELDGALSVGKLQLDDMLKWKQEWEAERKAFLTKYPHSFWKALANKYNEHLIKRSDDLVAEYHLKNSALRQKGAPFAERKQTAVMIANFKKLKEQNIRLRKRRVQKPQEWIRYQDVYQCERLGMKLFTILNFDRMYE